MADKLMSNLIMINKISPFIKIIAVKIYSLKQPSKFKKSPKCFHENKVVNFCIRS